MTLYRYCRSNAANFLAKDQHFCFVTQGHTHMCALHVIGKVCQWTEIRIVMMQCEA